MIIIENDKPLPEISTSPANDDEVSMSSMNVGDSFEVSDQDFDTLDHAVFRFNSIAKRLGIKICHEHVSDGETFSCRFWRFE